MTGYPWSQGDALLAADLNAAIINGPYMAGGAFSLIYFGAKSDGTTDDTAALNAAIAAIIALPHGGKLILPAGRTVIGSAITANIPAGVTLTIEGMGQGASELYLSNATDGLNFKLLNSGNAWGAVNLNSLSVVRGPTSPAIANTGIAITADPTVASMYLNALAFRDLIIRGSTPNVNQWANSLVLTGLTTCSIDNVVVRANNATLTDQGDTGLTINGGPSGSQYTSGMNIINSVFQGASCGVSINGYVQGVLIANSHIIGNYDSVRWVSTAANVAEELAIANCDIGGSHRGVYATFVNQISTTGTTILRFLAGVSGGFAGIEINHGAYCSVVGNNIIGLSSTNETGIIFSTCGAGCHNTVLGNVVANLTGTGIWLATTTSGMTVVGNDVAGGSASIVQDTFGNTVFANTWQNTPIATVFRQPIDFVSAGNGNSRWFVGNDGSTESGSNTGNNYQIVRCNDAGGVVSAALSINRATGNISFGTIPTSYANDAAAAAGGVVVGQMYRNGSILQMRVS